MRVGCLANNTFWKNPNQVKWLKLRWTDSIAQKNSVGCITKSEHLIVYFWPCSTSCKAIQSSAFVLNPPSSTLLSQGYFSIWGNCRLGRRKFQSNTERRFRIRRIFFFVFELTCSKALGAGDAIINQFEYITRPTQFPANWINLLKERRGRRRKIVWSFDSSNAWLASSNLISSNGISEVFVYSFRAMVARTFLAITPFFILNPLVTAFHRFLRDRKFGWVGPR